MTRHVRGWLGVALVLAFLTPCAPADEVPRLGGEWEVLLLVGDEKKETGLVTSIEQSGKVLTATYTYVHRDNVYGIRRGFDFFRATIDGLGGRGKIATRKGNVHTDERIEKVYRPCTLEIHKRHHMIRITIEAEDVARDESRFLLVRPAAVTALRLYVKTPAGLEPARKIIEGVPMVVEAERGAPSVTPVDVVLRSGPRERAETLELKAVLADDVPKALKARLFRTREFIPTFGEQLGVVVPPAEEIQEELGGRKPTGKDWKEIEGSYKTVYHDAVLGKVEGWARINEFGNVGCRYRHPKRKTWHELELVEARVKNEVPPGELVEAEATEDPAARTWTLVFKGRGVVSDPVEPLEEGKTPLFYLDTRDPEPITITAGGREAQPPLKRSETADEEKVTLELLQRKTPNLFIWDWTYLANRGTARDGVGQGRVGVLMPPERGDSSIAPMLGREAWLRTPTRVVAAICTENQLAIDEKNTWVGEKVPEYRFGTRHRKLRMSDGTIHDDPLLPTGNWHRHVFIVAHDLPPGKLSRLRMKAAEKSGVTEYRILDRNTEANASGDLEKAWKAYREGQKAQSAGKEKPVVEQSFVESPSSPDAPPEDKGDAAPPKEEGVLVLAIFERGTPPGYQDFTLNGAEGRWWLLYGDTVAKLEIVRMTAEADEQDDLPRQWEAVTTAYVPERVRISVSCPTAVEEQKVIRAAVTVDKTPGTLDGKKLIPLTPDPREPGRYLSAPIELVREHELKRFENRPGEITLPAKNGSRLKVMVGPEPGYLVTPIKVEVRVLDSPAKINRLWKAAIVRAAAVAEVEIDDWNKVARGESGAATNFFITNYAFNSPFTLTGLIRTQMENLTKTAEGLGIEVPMAKWWKREAGSRDSCRSIPISIGDHAAMFLLRDEFRKMMGEQIADWQKNQSHPKVAAIYAAQRQAIAEKRSPLSFFAIPLHRIQGLEKYDEEDETYLYEFFDDEYLSDELAVPKTDWIRDELQRNAYEYAYRNWGGQMRRAVQDAVNIPDEDLEKLMELTGHGFEPVAARVLPQMMKLKDDDAERRSRWVPDLVARSYIRSLAIVAAAVKAQEEYSEADTAVALAVASLISIPLGNIGGFWTAMAALSLTVIDAAHAIYTDIYENSLNEDQLQREAAMGAVLGYGRAAALKARIKEGWEQALSVGGAVLGGIGDGATVYKAVRSAKNLKLAAMVGEGTDLMKQIDFADPSQLRALSKRQQAVLSRFADDAKRLKSAGKGDELSKQQLDALLHEKTIDEALMKGANEATSTTKSAEAPPLPLKALETVTEDGLGKALKQVGKATDDVGKRIEDLKGSNPAPFSRAETRLQQAKDAAADLKVRKQVLEQLEAEARTLGGKAGKGGKGTVQIAGDDLDLLMGDRMQLNQLDRAEAIRAIERHGSSWGKIKKLAKGSGQDQLLLHKVGMYRRAEINRLADEAMAEVEAMTGGKHRRKALGSTNLTSDYDVSIEGPDAELAVRRFIQKSRKFFGDRESGTVIDSNLYTDPIYTVYRASELAGQEGKVSQAQFDATRQFVFQQMANAKYRTPTQWKALRKRMLDRLPRGVRKPMSDLLDQAEGARVSAERAIRSRIDEAVVQGAKAGDDLTLKVNNDLYGDSLGEIHQYRKMVEHLDAVRNGRARAAHTPLPPALRGPPYDELLPKLDEAFYGRDPVAKKLAKDALDQLHGRAVLNMRSKQGEALYYAAEAYQTRGTIAHVVGQLQKGEVEKVLDADELLDGVRRRTDLTPDDYVNSYYENGANLTKELLGKHVIDEAGKIIGDSNHLMDAAEKAAKYYLRQMDAAQMAGVDLRKVGIPDVDAFTRRAIALDRTRGKAGKFPKVLAGKPVEDVKGWNPPSDTPAWSPEEFLQRVLDATEKLDGEVVKHSSVMGFAKDLSKVDSFATKTARELLGRPSWALPVRRPRWADPGEETDRSRREFAAGPGAELEVLRETLGAGRHLTQDQRSRMATLLQSAQGQERLDRLATAARLAGLEPPEIDATLEAARAQAADGGWRDDASRGLTHAIHRRAEATEPRDPSARGSTTPELLERLGLKGSMAPDESSNRERLVGALRAAGHYVASDGASGTTADALRTQLAAGRSALVLVDRPGSEGPDWAPVRRVEQDAGGEHWVVTEDLESGAEVAWPAPLFETRSRESRAVVLSPYRTSDGGFRERPRSEGADAGQPSTEVALPLPGEAAHTTSP